MLLWAVAGYLGVWVCVLCAMAALLQHALCAPPQQLAQLQRQEGISEHTFFAAACYDTSASRHMLAVWVLSFCLWGAWKGGSCACFGVFRWGECLG